MMYFAKAKNHLVKEYAPAKHGDQKEHPLKRALKVVLLVYLSTVHIG
jgi:hypothetical protein